MMKYTVWAHSPSLNEWQCQVNIELNQQLLTEHTAKQWADAFASTLNQQQKLRATDWHGVVKYEATGIESVPEYLFHDPAR
jgi:hypothetical protein